jgi:hypothetical protein
MPNKNILALDLGTKMGWAMRNGSGVWDFKLSKFDSKIIRLIDFRETLKATIESYYISLVELPLSLSKDLL